MNCGICYTHNNLTRTKCNHIFCEVCISTWLNVEQKYNCPVCRRSVYGFKKIIIPRKNKIIKRIINTRSKTKEARWNKLSKTISELFDDCLAANNRTKIKKIELLFKNVFDNLNLIKQKDNQDKTLLTLLNNILKDLQKNKFVIKNNYIDKIKLWSYKLNKAY